jgi:hypothetical protein
VREWLSTERFRQIPTGGPHDGRDPLAQFAGVAAVTSGR